MTRILLTLVLTLGSLGILLSQTTLTGKIVDKESLETVPFATVAIYKNGSLITGTDTDFDGNYLFSNIDPGTYDVEASFLGYATSRITGVVVNADKENSVNFEMIEEGEMLEEIIVTGYKVPLISPDETSTGGTITAESIKTLPSKNINALAATTAGLSTVNGTDISVRGARSNSTYVYIDGVRVNSNNVNNLIPQSEIEQLQVVTGGIEAKYGDVTGGVISITSKGPSEYYSGGIELETSHFLDPYGYKLASGNISGPLLKKKISETQEKSIIGFRLSGQYRNIDDANPSFVGVNRMPLDVIEGLEANPLFNIGETAFPRADTLTNYSNPEILDAAPNEKLIDWNVSAKIDARLNDNIDVSISGGYFDLEDQFTPFSRTANYSTTNGRNGLWSLLNWNNNPIFNREGYRANVRFRHRLGRQAIDQGEGEAALVQNAYYTLQGGIEKNKRGNSDPTHGDNLFNYGYWGSTDVTWQPFATPNTSGVPNEFDTDIGGIPFRHQEYQMVTGEFTPDLTINPTIATYNAASSAPLNGMNDPDYRDVWGIYHNAGQVYNNFFKAETDIYTLQVTSGFDLIPGTSNDGKHSIQFGFLYEQRVRRSYSMDPQALWTIARGAANRQFFGVTDEVIGEFDQFGQTFTQFQANIIPEEFEDLYFFKRVRDVTGDALTDRVNVDGLTPDQLSLDLFAPGELINDVNLDLNYFGYDYLGNKLDNGVTFDDFFEATDENGVRTFDVAPLQPVYAAGYIQDKFTFRDIIFRAGVRVDYFDANTKVLKDQFSLYEIEDASVWHANNGSQLPETIGEDWKVYVQDSDAGSVQAYRNGEEWFTPNGTSVNNPSALFSGTIVTPVFKDADNRTLNITSQDFDPDTSFEDYTPQFNVMPRLAFSFPISDEAGFFAHYDVLVQRPPSNTESTALNYFYFESFPNRFSSDFDVAGNPNLRPEKTIDYQVGFQQKLSNSSAIKVAAYYRELRDMIQRQIIVNVPNIGSYETFGNIDFGTVKGFSFGYDLRRTGNLTLKANYTLQFANGSGSDANSGRGLNTNGVIRELFPFSYDERHRFNVVLDYRYGEGKQYTGPKIAGIDIFANTGANFIISTVSGRPYSQFGQIQNPFGQTDIQNINGSRLPWLFNTDVRFDKQMSFGLSPDSKKKLNANVYLRFENLFNSRNVIDVYNVSQSADDDGWLISEFGLDQLNTVAATGRSVEGYLSSYQWRLLNPNHFAAPRRIYLGVIFGF